MNAELLMLVGGCAAFAVTFYWVRSRELSERHALGWMAVGLLLLGCGLFPELIMQLADISRLSYPAAVLCLALAAMYLFAFSVSVSLTRLHRRSVRLLQEVALLEGRLRELESSRSAERHPGRHHAAETAEREPAAPGHPL